MKNITFSNSILQHKRSSLRYVHFFLQTKFNKKKVIKRRTTGNCLAEMAKEVINNFANYRQPDLIDEYRKRSLLFGKNVTLKLGTKAVNGKVEGISDDGSLILKAKSGELQTFKSGEVVKVDW